MIYNIAICDDEIFTCSKIEQVIQEYAEKNDIRVELNTFYRGEVLIKEIENKKYFDMIFLDVDLITMSGVDVGRKLRNQFLNESTQIIYISSRSSYAMQLFKTRPMDFLIKPLDKSEIIEIFMQTSKVINQGNKTFEFSVGRVDYKVQYKDILYFRSIGRKILLVLDKENIEFYSKLDKIVEQLPPWEFLQIHKSYVVNANNVVKYGYEIVEMKNGEVISVSRAKRKHVKEQIMLQKCKKEEKRYGA